MDVLAQLLSEESPSLNDTTGGSTPDGSRFAFHLAENPRTDSSNHMQNVKDLSASTVSTFYAEPDAYQSSFPYSDHILWPLQEHAPSNSLSSSIGNDFNLDYNLSQQELSEWCEALDSEMDMFTTFEQSNQPSEDPVNTNPSDWPSLWEDTLLDVAVNDFPTATKSINDYQTPALTECSTPISPSTSQSNSACTKTLSNDFETDNQRWHATQLRLRAGDPFFLYGVLSTKIFCRPSCASRRPSRRHVRFFPFPGAIEAAQRANFRPCKRCKPELLGTTNIAVLGICQVLRNITAATNNSQGSTKEKHTLKLDVLAHSAGLSSFHFHRQFKATTQITPGDFISACRSLALQDALGKDSFMDAGTFSDPRKINKTLITWSPRTARKALGGIAPAEYANGAPSTDIKHCCVENPRGRIFIAFSQPKAKSEAHVHAVMVGPDAELRMYRRFPGTMASVEHSQTLDDCVRRLAEEGRDRDTELSADVVPALWRARIWLRLVQPWGG